ncbi:hypothetical protein [Kibdelosporangium philippinense]|uniref:hypothetical protein n=1 Tax=Kibdelosporangium philippinense TaxID=211113 RepID=UPI00360BE5F9
MKYLLDETIERVGELPGLFDAQRGFTIAAGSFGHILLPDCALRYRTDQCDRSRGRRSAGGTKMSRAR